MFWLGKLDYKSNLFKLVLSDDLPFQEIKYAEGKKNKKSKDKKNVDGLVNPLKQHMPQYITCQVGFGLLRSFKI